MAIRMVDRRNMTRTPLTGRPFDRNALILRANLLWRRPSGTCAERRGGASSQAKSNSFNHEGPEEHEVEELEIQRIRPDTFLVFFVFFVVKASCF
jgi:hypothetical protein